MKATIGGNLKPTDLYDLHSDKKVILGRNEVQELAEKAKVLWQTQN
jgi:hypothetical protein